MARSQQVDLRVLYSCGWWAVIVLPLVATVRIAEASGADEVVLSRLYTFGPARVVAGRVEAGVANIISNAAESYVRGQGARVEIGARLDAATATVYVTVTDYGCGMDAETLRKATTPFFSLKTAGRKRGMGLAFARRFLQINGCGMTIDSEPGMGTTVTVSMPAAGDERC